jgi:hypothetical protein
VFGVPIAELGVPRFGVLFVPVVLVLELEFAPVDPLGALLVCPGLVCAGLVCPGLVVCASAGCCSTSNPDNETAMRADKMTLLFCC